MSNPRRQKACRVVSRRRIPGARVAEAMTSGIGSSPLAAAAAATLTSLNAPSGAKPRNRRNPVGVYQGPSTLAGPGHRPHRHRCALGIASGCTEGGRHPLHRRPPESATFDWASCPGCEWNRQSARRPGVRIAASCEHLINEPNDRGRRCRCARRRSRFLDGRPADARRFQDAIDRRYLSATP